MRLAISVQRVPSRCVAHTAPQLIPTTSGETNVNLEVLQAASQTWGLRVGQDGTALHEEALQLRVRVEEALEQHARAAAGAGGSRKPRSLLGVAARSVARKHVKRMRVQAAAAAEADEPPQPPAQRAAAAGPAGPDGLVRPGVRTLAAVFEAGPSAPARSPFTVLAQQGQVAGVRGPERPPPADDCPSPPASPSRRNPAPAERKPGAARPRAPAPLPLPDSSVQLKVCETGICLSASARAF